EGRLAVDRGGLAAGVLERVHLAVKGHAPPLDAAVVTATEDPAGVDDDRPDRDASFGNALFGFGDGCLHERVGHGGDCLPPGRAGGLHPARHLSGCRVTLPPPPNARNPSNSFSTSRLRVHLPTGSPPSPPHPQLR